MDLENYLPQGIGVANGFRKGRNVHDGYQRGAGLQFTDLADKVRRDPLYKEALHISKNRSIMTEHNRINIYLILKFYLPSIPEGDIIEFGSYLGGNALFMAYVVKKLYPKRKVFALDTFEGMPDTDKAVDAHNKGDFSDVDLDELKKFSDDNKLDNLLFVKGLFEDTAKSVLANNRAISLAHIDCDIMSAVHYSYDVSKPNMVPGGYYVFDDGTVSSCIGATEVIEDIVVRRDGLNSEQIYPHFVFREPLHDV